MHLYLADYLLWLSSPVIQLGVLFAISRRRLRHICPYFFLYTLLTVAAEPVLFLCQHASYTAYYYAYYANLLISIVLSFAVFLDVFNNAFSPRNQLRHMISLMFWSSIAFILAVAVLRGHGNASELRPLFDLVLFTDRLLRVAQCALLLLLFFFRKYVGISRRDFIFGIALGFGFFAVINMLETRGMHHGGFLQPTLRISNSIAYLLTSWIWLGYALWGQVHPRPSPDTLIAAEG